MPGASPKSVMQYLQQLASLSDTRLFYSKREINFQNIVKATGLHLRLDLAPCAIQSTGRNKETLLAVLAAISLGQNVFWTASSSVISLRAGVTF